MPNDTTVRTTKLRRLEMLPPEPHQRMFLPKIAVGDILWCHAERRSSLGGYVGTYSKTYRHWGGISPTGMEFQMLREYTSDYHLLDAITESDMPKYKSHVGLNYTNDSKTTSLFGFQLLADDGRAHAFVDFTNGVPDRIGFTGPLEARRDAIVRLASIHQRKHQGASE